MARLILLNKPYGVLSQFTENTPGQQTLSGLIPLEGVYPAGRLDRDSEGLLLLTDDGRLQHRISHPSRKMPKTYWVQVEGTITEEALQQLKRGVLLKNGMTKPAQVRQMETPVLPPRNPPVRERKHIPTCWISITLAEGRNRQIRRMTAAVGFPTLRLIRVQIGEWVLDDLQPGEWREIVVNLPVEKSGATKTAGRRDRRNSAGVNPRARNRKS